MSVRDAYQENGFVLLRSFFDYNLVTQVKRDAQSVFLRQARRLGIWGMETPSETDLESMMAQLFREDQEAFINCGKICQHLVRLHQLSLHERIIDQLFDLGIRSPSICTRPVLYFNARHLAKVEAYYKTPAHQDWRSMQGSLNSIVVWVPLVDIDYSLGALEVIPRSHLDGLHDSEPDEWYRRISDSTSREYVPVEVQTGDALFFSSFLVHRSGDNITSRSIRWSCHFRYNDLDETTYIQRKFPVPYIYKPQQDLVTPNFPSTSQVQSVFHPKELGGE